ncbi:MAG: VCBS repeat-containing protein [Polyangiaceae bacterium]
MKRTLLLAFVPPAIVAMIAASCGDNGTNSSTGGSTTSTAGGTTGGGGATTSTAGTAGSGGGLLEDGGDCASQGAMCGDGGVCAGGVCCDPVLACANECCAMGQVCSFQKCVTPGDVCVDATDCPQGDLCDYSLGDSGGGGAGGAGGSCMGGVVPPKGKCMPKPPECAPGQDPGDPIVCLQECQYKPPTNDFGAEVKYAWGGVAQGTPNDVMMTPIVVELDDDNCDGKVNQDDIPEIVFSTFTSGGYFKMGTLHAISIVGGQVVDKWSAPNMVQPGGGLAAADLDGDGVPEIVGCMNPGPSGSSCCDATAQDTGVIAFRADGTTFWTQTDTTKVHCGYQHPAIGDVDQDGHPEVLVGHTLLDGATGAVKMELDPATSWGNTLSGLVDVDGDGLLDVVDGRRAYRADGSVIWDLRTGANQLTTGYHAVGDFDGDGLPEVVIISSSAPHAMSIIHYDPASDGGAKVIRKNVDINNGTSTKVYCNAASEYGGGPPTVADFNGDGTPDIGAAGAVGYVVFDGKKLMDPNVPDAMTTLWFKTTHDCSSAVTGSAVFDFNGDGKAEAVYSDEYHLWMYDGQTGDNLLFADDGVNPFCNTTGTLWEYPVVADVDNDGQADIVVASNAYSSITCPEAGSKQSGIRVFGSKSGSWVRTRRVWNEHTYHITNIGEDGQVPVMESPNWTVPGLNDYRQNRQPEGEFSAPDAVVSVAPKCFGDYGIVATVRNLGSASLPAGVPVGFYSGAMPGTKLGDGATKKTLYPAEAEAVTLLLPNAPAGVLDGSEPVFAIVDDGAMAHNWHECRTDNNTSDPKSGKCDEPQ